VRIGINTGEVQERDGDYFGPAVNRAARLMAAGHGGQVLIAGVTADLVPGLTLRNLGEHRLRDLGSPILVWQLGTDEFPPLRTLDELPGNLPVQRTSFIGRAGEVKELAALVTKERLVTLTGPGGVGKSRLALQVAAEVAPVFRDGVWFASLATLEESALVAATILEALGVPERQGEPAVETLCVWANTREALVLIDNCEHLLIEVAAVVDRVMESSTTSAMLTTSQAPLSLRGEHAWAVAPLSGPPGVSSDSVELFVDRARMARADFSLNAENEEAVGEICERLDHVPLAIELAAARVRGMTPADIARRLDHRLRLLASSDQLAPGRHRTLDAAVRWSYELLDETQRRVFDRLSVFVGPFTIEAAEAVVSGDGVDEWEVLDGILALVDKSLVIADETAGATRYRLLETMRQFGNTNLTAVGIDASYRDRYADYYAEYVLSRRPQLHGSGDVAALEDVERELENIRVALRQAADDRSTSRFEEIFSALHTLWVARGRNSEGASWAAELLGRPDLEPRARIVALGFAASVTNPTSLAAAHELAAAATDLSATTGAAPPLFAMTVMSLGAMMQGRTEDAIAGCDQVQALAADEPEPFIRAWSLSSSIAVLGICGAFDHLDALRRDLTALVEQLDNRYLQAANATSLAPIIHVTDPDGAREYLLRACALNDEMRNAHANSTSTMFLALHELRSGDAVAAARWARRSLELCVDVAPSYVAQTTNAIVGIVKRHSPSDAAVLLGALRARKHQAGTQAEIDAEARSEVSLRRALSDQFDALYAQGLVLDETQMIRLAFAQLDEIAQT
ncbi:MAG: adenylate/guanylate cyclase domain-containing protein, partial [Actinomycetota bacterium]|nr:adenylate/guanylate cyclase domain-containing protein [Actinomycetota bacterium]